MSGARGTLLYQYSNYEIVPLTEAQAERLWGHIDVRMSGLPDRIEMAEALGLTGYLGHDTRDGVKGQGREAWRSPTPIEEKERQAS